VRFKIAGQICRFAAVPSVGLSVRSIFRSQTPAGEPEENPMAKFVYVYIGGQMAETPEAQEQAMQAWGVWFGTLGDSVADMGNPFGNSATVSSGGVADGGKSGAGGYSIVSAGSLSDATAKAKGCPVLASGGSVEIYEAIPM
jgi:hypothetical protein